jgi:hypothetical protein
MKSVFLILVHANNNQLQRLINTICDEDSVVYIHVDLKTDIQIFKEYRKFPNLIFIKKRVSINWGAYSMVQGMINGFVEIIQNSNKDQYVSVISGQDYPLMRNAAMNEFLQANHGKAFMEFYPIYEEWKEAIPRLEKFYFTDYKFPGKFNMQIALNKYFPKRKPPKSLIYVGRSQWFTLTVEHLKYIVDFLESHHSIRRFFSLTWGGDEFVFQTILYNSEYRSQMVNNNLRYIDWTQGGVSPKILTMADATDLGKSGKFFARKFDEKIDSHILDWIDANLLTEKTV